MLFGPRMVLCRVGHGWPRAAKKILEHLKKKDDTQEAVQLPDARAPPQGRLFD